MDHLIPMPLDFTPGAILFDCDGTLVDTMPLHYRAWRHTLDTAGQPTLFPESQFYAWGGVCASEILVRLNRDHGTDLDVDALTHAKEMAYRDLIPQLAGIDAVLAEVRRFHGTIPLAVVSGGMGLVVRESLRIVGIEHCFDTIVGSEDSPRSKPAPDPFLIAAERLGVAPELCVVFEDAPAGLEGARAAGMKAVDITRHLPPR
jgi:HAD superfamily hydrolase (TIGR01509 family)